MKKHLLTNGFRMIIALFAMIIGVLSLGKVELQAQISVTPTVIFIESNTRTGSVTLKNNSAQPKEIDISFKYGYTGLDSSGASTVLYDDTETADEYSLVPYISSFPKRLVLQGNSEQTVRLLVRGLPTDLAPKALWARMSVKAQDIAKQIDTTTIENISAQFVFVMETMNPIFFYNGEVSMGIETGKIETFLEDDKMHLLIDCQRSGNAPFLGSAEMKVYDLSGKLIDTQTSRTAVYFTNKARFVFDKSIFKTGKYKAEVTFSNERDDVPQQRRLKFQPLTKLFEFEINSL